ncbi:hypothetical protein L1887_42395 [Cichorium endivia]|nr:hypothetical protein L1887_42395 [Cichorium endivia]
MMYRLEPKKPHMFSFFEINIIIPRTWQNFNFTLDSSNSRSLSSITQRPNSIFPPPFLCILIHHNFGRESSLPSSFLLLSLSLQLLGTVSRLLIKG